MKHFIVTASTGTECGVVAETEGGALDTVAKTYGYDTYLEMCSDSDVQLEIREFDADNHD